MDNHWEVTMIRLEQATVEHITCWECKPMALGLDHSRHQNEAALLEIMSCNNECRCPAIDEDTHLWLAIYKHTIKVTYKDVTCRAARPGCSIYIMHLGVTDVISSLCYLSHERLLGPPARALLVRPGHLPEAWHGQCRGRPNVLLARRSI